MADEIIALNRSMCPTPVIKTPSIMAMVKRLTTALIEKCYIIKILQPGMLLIEGFRTYQEIGAFASFASEEHLRLRGRRLATVVRWKNILVYCMIHPSGARMNKVERDSLRKHFCTTLRELKLTT